MTRFQEIKAEVVSLLSSQIFKRGYSMVLWQGVTLVLTFASTVWIARCLGPYELGRSGFIIATGGQILILLSVCPTAFAVRYLKDNANSEDAITLLVTIEGSGMAIDKSQIISCEVMLSVTAIRV